MVYWVNTDLKCSQIPVLLLGILLLSELELIHIRKLLVRWPMVGIVPGSRHFWGMFQFRIRTIYFDYLISKGTWRFSLFILSHIKSHHTSCSTQNTSYSLKMPRLACFWWFWIIEFGIYWMSFGANFRCIRGHFKDINVVRNQNSNLLYVLSCSIGKGLLF